MPLKRTKKLDLTKNPNPVDEGPIIQSAKGIAMNLFDKAKLPAITLNANQFIWPKTLLVVSELKRVDEYEKNPDTGWDLKDDDGKKIPTGRKFVRLTVTDGDAAQTLLDMGQTLNSLSGLQLTIKKDIPIQAFKPNETLIELKGVNVMLGFGGRQADRIVLIADDYKEV